MMLKKCIDSIVRLPGGNDRRVLRRLRRIVEGKKLPYVVLSDGHKSFGRNPNSSLVKARIIHSTLMWALHESSKGFKLKEEEARHFLLTEIPWDDLISQSA